MKRKICVVTGTRAEYGLLKNLLKLIKENEQMFLQLIVTGSHLSEKHGSTYKTIENDGFRITKKIHILSDEDSSVAIANAMSLAIAGFANAYEEVKPDLLIVLGDRFEIFSAVAAAQLYRIPVAHLHGGELTEGAIDDAFRHSITKMSHLHFVATEEYRRRVVQLGESPENVHLVGGLGVDAISLTKILTKEEIESTLKIKFLKKSLLITFHPVTLGNLSSEFQIKELLRALVEVTDTTLIFTMPNADSDHNVIFESIRDFVATRPNSYAFDSLGQELYLSCLAQVNGVIGNSSSGLTEAPTFRIGTINIGDRQMGRIKAASVIDCEPTAEKILQALSKLQSEEFISSLAKVDNPYGDGGASESILQTLKFTNLETLVKKNFYDLETL